MNKMKFHFIILSRESRYGVTGYLSKNSENVLSYICNFLKRGKFCIKS